MTTFLTKLASGVTALALVATFVPAAAFAQEFAPEATDEVTNAGNTNPNLGLEAVGPSTYRIEAIDALTVDKSAALLTAGQVEAAHSGLTKVTVGLVSNNEGDATSTVRINPTTGGAGNVQLWTKEASSGNWYDVAAMGWGPGTGFDIGANYTGSIDVYVVANTVGSYTLAHSAHTFSGGVVAGDTTVLTVVEPTSAVVTNEAQLTAALANTNITTITFGGDITVTSAAKVNRSVSINGAGHSLTGGFTKTDNSNNSVLMINNPATAVEVTDLVVDGGTAANNLHGINVWQASNVKLTDVVAKNSNSGINVNDSSVTVNDVTTTNNRWGGINVDKGTATLVVNGVSSHNDVAGKPAIWKDDNSMAGVTVTGSMSQYTASVQPVNSTTGTLYFLSTVKNEAELNAALANANIPTITLGASFRVAATVSITRPVTIVGAGKTITGSAGIGQVILVQNTQNVSVSDLTVDGLDKNIHGLQAYMSSNVTLNSLTLKDNGKSGLLVNGSGVTVTDLTTSGNGWNGVNVDRGVNVSSIARLTVNGTSEHDETDAIWVDDITKAGVSVIDTNGQYVSSERAYVNSNSGLSFTGRVYVLAPEEEETDNSSGRSGSSRRSTSANTGGEVAGASTGGEVLGAETYNFAADLTIGSTGNDVIELQKMLIASGDLAIAAPTGYFGEMTKAALTKWQAKHGVPATGYFGPLTRAAIKAMGTPAMSADARATLIKDLLDQVKALQEKLDAAE